MRMAFWMFLMVTFMSGWGFAADLPASSNTTQAIFTKVQGKVQVQVPNRKKPKKAQKDLVVTQGDRIMTSEDSSAVLRLFDGSELKIDAQTEFVLSEMKKPSDEDKNFKFSLFVGKLTAVVKKLTSASSSFEVEAGGVVCGVRGTQFEMGYNPHKNSVSLNVFEGSVWARSNGGAEHVFRAGQQQIFNNVHPNTSPNGGNSQNNKGGNTTNNNGNGGNGGNSGNAGTGGNGGTGSGDSGNGGTGTNSGNSSTNGTGATGANSGAGGTTDSANGAAGGNAGTGGNTGNPGGGNAPGTNPLSDPALQVMTTNVQKIISTNNNNTLNTAQQNTSIALHVGPGEVIP